MAAPPVNRGRPAAKRRRLEPAWHRRQRATRATARVLARLSAPEVIRARQLLNNHHSSLANSWVCSQCATSNFLERSTCRSCGLDRQQEPIRHGFIQQSWVRRQRLVPPGAKRACQRQGSCWQRTRTRPRSSSSRRRAAWAASTATTASSAPDTFAFCHCCGRRRRGQRCSAGVRAQSQDSQPSVNIMPALPSVARLFAHFPSDFDENAYAAERTVFINDCRQQLKILPAPSN